jgi:hypothetical protein
MKNGLSVICPFVNEYPQVYFTLANLVCELQGCDFNWEIIAIDNICKEAEEQIYEKVPVAPKIIDILDNIKMDKLSKDLLRTAIVDTYATKRRGRDKGSERVQGRCIPANNMKYIQYDTKLSHWQAKNVGVRESQYDVLLFIDSHCIVAKNSIIDSYKCYINNYDELNGSLHLPILYMLEDIGLDLIYKLVLDLPKGVIHYSFTRRQIRDKIIKVPCMSTCGMFLSRELYDIMGGWPSELGIYGGGENFINFVLSILGKDKNIMNTNPFHHFAEKRGYNWNYTDFHRNRTIASYMYGDKEWARKYVYNIKGKPSVLDSIYTDVTTGVCQQQREHIKKSQKMTIEDWIAIQK